MTFTWLDFLLGVMLTIGFVYLIYVIDRKYVYKKEALPFWRHIWGTGFFPKRMVGYLAALALVIAFVNGAYRELSPGSLSYDILRLVLRIAIYPFLILIAICSLFVLKIIFFPHPDDPDRVRASRRPAGRQ